MDTQIATLDLSRPLPETSPAALEAFCTDCARKIHDGHVIAERYGFADKTHLKTWLLEHPAVFRQIKELQAVWESAGNVETKARTLAGFATIEAIPSITQIALSPDIAPTVRNDSFKELAKVAGVSGLQPVARTAGNGPGADAQGRFSVQIVFASQGRVESFTTHEPPREPPTIEEDES
jgi:hypothetical protein